jgi:hypothetical protein
MSTVVMTEAPPQADTLALLPIAANLLPQEVIDQRRTRKARWVVAFALAAVLVVVAGWDVRSRQQTASARQSLAGLQTQDTRLQKQTTQFGPLQQIQAQTAALNATLKGLSADNLPWYTLLPDVTAVARRFHGASFDTVSGQLNIGGVGAPAVTLPSSSAATPIGSLILHGIAPDKSTIAAIVDGLSDVKGVADVYLTGASQATGGCYTFSVSAVITSAALGGQFGSAAIVAPGGK